MKGKVGSLQLMKGSRKRGEDVQKNLYHGADPRRADGHDGREGDRLEWWAGLVWFLQVLSKPCFHCSGPQHSMERPVLRYLKQGVIFSADAVHVPDATVDAGDVADGERFSRPRLHRWRRGDAHWGLGVSGDAAQA